MTNRAGFWNEERSARLAELWSDYTLTAAKIGETFGVSKDAIIRRAYTMRLARRVSPLAPVAAESERLSAGVVDTLAALLPPDSLTEAMPRSDAVARRATRERLIPRAAACCWPLWDRATKPGINPAFCGQAIQREGKSYCNTHLQKAYIIKQFKDLSHEY